MERKTKIVCTIGPASCAQRKIEELIREGMNVARINLSHGTREEHQSLIQTIRKACAVCDAPVAILLDTKGAQIRTGDVKEPITIKKGEEVMFTPHECTSKQHCIHVNYDGFAGDVRETDTILIDNGELSFDIVSINDDGTVVAKARQDGHVGSRRHVNLPGADIDLPSVTQKDWDDIAFAIRENIDFIALSFIRGAGEVEEVRTFLNKKKSDIELIAKIETAQAVENIQDIIRVSDGIMVARGDLGAEIPFERIPAIQDAIVSIAQDAGKPVIVATHMLESMIEHPIPTRAEITDVAHAVITQADATMLSGETASGKHPTVALSAMNRIILETERNVSRFVNTENGAVHDEREARSYSAVALAENIDAPAIVVFTRSGRTAAALSKFRPPVPIIALTPNKSVQHHLQLRYGVIPLLLPFENDPEHTVHDALAQIREAGLVESGARVVVVSDTRTSEGGVSTVQVRAI